MGLEGKGRVKTSPDLSSMRTGRKMIPLIARPLIKYQDRQKLVEREQMLSYSHVEFVVSVGIWKLKSWYLGEKSGLGRQMCELHAWRS